jgi:hypothetical protein
MGNIGWEIRPAGWILLFVVTLVVLYLLDRRLRDSSGKNPHQLS